MHTAWWWRRAGRIAWATLTVAVVETVLLGIAVLPAVAFVAWQGTWPLPDWQRLALAALAFVPLYLLGAFLLMICTAGATRLLGWRTPSGLKEPVMEGSWAVLTWARYLMTIHVVRVFAGPAFRSTPAWSWYLRLNGARLGRGVWVNSLALMDHNLLEFGDGVVIGSDAHVSGHVVERGVLKTARVRLGAGVLVGTGSVVGIGVTAEPGAQVGALTVVPKFRTLAAGHCYMGAPARAAVPARALPAGPERPRPPIHPPTSPAAPATPMDPQSAASGRGSPPAHAAPATPATTRATEATARATPTQRLQ